MHTPHSEYNTLSVRENQAFNLLAGGKSQQEVADKLFINPKTVSKHVVSNKKKLNVKNSAQIANDAKKIGLGTSMSP